MLMMKIFGLKKVGRDQVELTCTLRSISTDLKIEAINHFNYRDYNDSRVPAGGGYPPETDKMVLFSRGV